MGWIYCCQYAQTITHLQLNRLIQTLPDGIQFHLFVLVGCKLRNKRKLTDLNARPSKLEHDSKRCIIEHFVWSWSSRTSETIVPDEEERAREKNQSNEMKYFPPARKPASTLINPDSDKWSRHSSSNLSDKDYGCSTWRTSREFDDILKKEKSIREPHGNWKNGDEVSTAVCKLTVPLQGASWFCVSLHLAVVGAQLGL